ncbi:MAG: type II toxin-antitoxin system VapC family toxin, partial [Anaerolineales bacterium]|nr:type II toxin-antitoxin system VapC family toxin [Anaerolineales bacterium]
HCVALLRGRLDLQEHVAPDEELAVTAISVGELAHGAHKSQRAADNLARLDVLLAALVILPYDESAARQFGRLKAHLEQEGARLSDLDLQIAGIAIAQNAPLVTHNQAHFARLVDLSLEDWL